MGKLIGIRKAFSPLVSRSQRLLSPEIVSNIRMLHLRFGKETSNRDKLQQKRPIKFIITILHRRPECGESVRFRSTYYAKETKDPILIKDIFKEAFRTAHPLWTIEEVAVKEIKE